MCKTQDSLLIFRVFDSMRLNFQRGRPIEVAVPTASHRRSERIDVVLPGIPAAHPEGDEELEQCFNDYSYCSGHFGD